MNVDTNTSTADYMTPDSLESRLLFTIMNTTWKKIQGFCMQFAICMQRAICWTAYTEFRNIAFIDCKCWIWLASCKIPYQKWLLLNWNDIQVP